jgi:O-antigen ligase
VLKEATHKTIYWWASAIVCVGMPLGEFIMSIGSIALFLNWILEGKFKEKFSVLKHNKPAVAILIIFALHLLGLLWTHDFDYAFRDLKVKLPILIFPLVFGSTKVFSRQEMVKLFVVFVAATLISTLISVGVYIKSIYGNTPLTSNRDISIFISHIRLSLMVVFSVVGMFYFLKQKELKAINVAFASIYFLFFLALLQSLTGWLLMLMFIGIYPLLWGKINVRNGLLSIIFFSIVISCLIAISKPSYRSYFVPSETEFPVFTEQGNAYAHNLQSKQLENGHYVWRNICDKELQEEWIKRSDISLADTDKKGQPIKATLIRYLTSMQLKKDAQGIKTLTELDIENIESGQATKELRNGVLQRVHEFFFEMAALREGQNPSNNSVGQRFFAWDLAADIIKKNLIIGVGTGDVANAFSIAYEQSDKVITKQIRAHNQYLTLLVAFGLLGIIPIFIFFYLAFSKASVHNGLKWLFYTIILFSFMFEDTLETQAGVTFFAFFAGLFCSPKNEIN